MQIFTVSFCGHRKIERVWEIENRLEQVVGDILLKQEYVEFLVGRDGQFDQLVSSVIRRCKRNYRSDNSAHIWVLPYPTAELRDHEEALRSFYDEIVICEEASRGYVKKAHQIRNRAMVDRSDLVIFCVQHEGGGAWQTLQYAKKQNKPYYNLHPQTRPER